MRRQHRWWKGVGAVPVLVLLGGCVSVEPYKVAIKGMADTGDAVAGDCLAPSLTPGQKAEVDAWALQRKAAHDLVNGK